MLAGILVSLVTGAWPAIAKYGLSFLTRSIWDPVQDEFGGLVMIYGPGEMKIKKEPAVAEAMSGEEVKIAQEDLSAEATAQAEVKETIE